MMSAAVLAVGALFAGLTLAGSLDPTNAPGPTMHTLEEIFQKLDAGTVVITVTNTVIAYTNVPLPKTGQTISYATGDDGDLEKGVALPNPRFTDNSNGTVTDNLTGLIWLKNANGFVTSRTWTTALANCATLNNGELGLTDGSSEGDWRLPNIKEMQSLIDFGRANPSLPLGHPFTGVKSGSYWSSSTTASNSGWAWGARSRAILAI
ncbi:DUF1566 domain-containing protein [Verrucomicrobiota bacterium]